MVLTKPELIAALDKEVHILVHLAGKLDRSHLDYRPTPKQRSAIELLRYLSYMGPFLVVAAKSGFDGGQWQAAAKKADGQSFDELVAAIASQPKTYTDLLANFSDGDFRGEITGFDGQKISRGAFIVSLVLGGYAAYRTQLFMYLKACGRDELTTSNLWRGVDPQPQPEAVA
jgi:hypothetical protein